MYKINLHILEPCNYHCKHCFSHFDSKKILPISDWKKIVDRCIDSIDVSEFNIAGGEPLLYPNLFELVKYIHHCSIGCSIITNGFLINDAWIENYAKYFTTIGFSIDSFCEETLISIGRCTKSGSYLSTQRFSEICRRIKEVNPECEIKMNTVVTTINKDENIAKVIRDYKIPISRWKIIRMKPFKNNYFDNTYLQISNEEYYDFVEMNSCVFDKTEYRKTNNGFSSILQERDDFVIIVERDVCSSYIMMLRSKPLL